MSKEIDNSEINTFAQKAYSTRTQTRGSLAEEYEIYCCCSADIGEEIKTFDDWLGS